MNQPRLIAKHIPPVDFCKTFTLPRSQALVMVQYELETEQWFIITIVDVRGTRMTASTPISDEKKAYAIFKTVTYKDCLQIYQRSEFELNKQEIAEADKKLGDEEQEQEEAAAKDDA